MAAESQSKSLAKSRKQWPGLRELALEDYELDPGIVISYEDDATIHAVTALPQAAAVPAPCPSGTVP